MEQKTLRFKKSRRSGAHSNCVEIAHALRHVRDSKNPAGPTLTGDLRRLVRTINGNRLGGPMP